MERRPKATIPLTGKKNNQEPEPTHCYSRALAAADIRKRRDAGQNEQDQKELFGRDGIGAQVEEGKVLGPKEFFDVAEVIDGDGFDARDKAEVLGGQTGLLSD